MVVGAWLFFSGGFTTEITYRIVDSSDYFKSISTDQSSSAIYAQALRDRLHDDYRATISTRGDYVTISTWGSERASLIDRLAITGKVQLVALEESNETNQSSSSLINVSPGLDLPDAISVTNSDLGRSVAIDGSIDLTNDLVTTIALPTYGSLRCSLSKKGRSALSELLEEKSLGFGLVIDGVLEGYALKEDINIKKIELRIATKFGESLTPEAIVAAIRGPEIPFELERIE